MSERPERIREAYLGLGEGSSGGFEALFADGAQWLGVPGRGFERETPT